jgi:predicted nucleic acid-binding Zn ribbon protein
MPRDTNRGEESDNLPDGAHHEDEPETVPCPDCRQPVPEDDDYCSQCKTFISLEDSPPARKPTWIVIGLLVCLALALISAFM